MNGFIFSKMKHYLISFLENQLQNNLFHPWEVMNFPNGQDLITANSWLGTQWNNE